MKSRLFNRKWSAVGLVLMAAVLIAGCGVLGGGAQPSSQTQGKDTISVSGFGEATGVPDMATVQLGVEVKAATIGEALETSSRTVERVRAALLAMGIAESDLQSTNFNTWPEDIWDPLTGQPTGERVFHVDSTLQVQVHDLGQLSQLIQAGLDAGATNVWGLNFGIDDSSALEAEARAMALEDASDRAQQLASAIGVTLGEPILVSELVGGGISPFALEAAFFRGQGGGGGGPPLSPGQLTVGIQVDVMYAIER